jgi:F-type H+-transporting ATPase subunit gamma
MPSLIDLRRRVRAVKNTQQITKAMKMVAASKLRRAQERMSNARPFALQMQRVLSNLAARVDPSVHPLLAVREKQPGSKTLLIVVSADKGLCGSFNTNIMKAAGAFIAASDQACVLGLVGRKARDFLGRRGFEVRFEEIGIFQPLSFASAQAIARMTIDAFLSTQVDRVVLLFNEFKSVISQRIVLDELLPIARRDVDGAETGPQIDYIYEPSPQAIFDQLLPRYIEVQIYRALLESNAAFFAAQMTAMDTATRNSGDMIADLTLYMNKVRQAAITREIIEVVSGAQAL